MTSKEALNQLYIMADTPELAMAIQSCYNIVEKDLEVLDILQKYITKDLKWFMYNNYDNWYWYMAKTQAIKITDEEFEKLREWLENDK